MLSRRLPFHLSFLKHLFVSRRLLLEVVLSLPHPFVFRLRFAEGRLNWHEMALFNAMASGRLFQRFENWVVHIHEILSLDDFFFTVLELGEDGSLGDKVILLDRYLVHFRVDFHFGV